MSRNLFTDYGTILTRDEIKKEPTDLEKILDLENEIITQYESNNNFGKNGLHHEEAYTLLYANVQEKIKNISLTPELLASYISTRENREENTKAIIRGMYSAALLQVTCFAQPDKSIFIDGRGKTFNYLFYHVKNASNVTIQNFKGNYIFGKAGLDGGYISYITLNTIEGNEVFSSAGFNGICKYLTLTDITGDYILSGAGSEKGNIEYIELMNITGYNTLSGIGSQKGTAKHISLNNIEGSYTLVNAGSDGNVSYLSINNLTGNKTLSNAGNNTGNISHVTLYNITGDHTLKDISSEGNSTHITLTKIKGSNTLEFAGNGKGNINHITLSEITGDLTLSNASEDRGNIQHLTLNKINGNDFFQNTCRYGGKINPILKEENFNERQKSILSKIQTIVETIHTLSFKEQKKAHEQIAKLQEEIFAGET